MYRAGIWDGKWTGKDGKTGKREFGARDGKMGRDSVPISRFPVHFPFFFKPVHSHLINYSIYKCLDITKLAPKLSQSSHSTDVDVSFWIKTLLPLHPPRELYLLPGCLQPMADHKPTQSHSLR
jgi:hypothetical protein